MLKPGPVPREALAYFRAKQLKPGFDYRDVWRQEHAHAFTVAKAMQADILVDIRDALDEAIAQGVPFRTFAQQLRPTLEAKGWWGRKDVVDPLTKEVVSAQLGSPRRLRTIYSANIRSARAAGQWERIQRTKATHPYLLYQLGPSEEHRVEHVSWAGTLLPADDPFWATHFTPNGWGCKCHIRQVSKAEYSRLAATGRYQTKAPRIERRQWVNKRTGEVEMVPAGIDPGWDINPGLARGKQLQQDVKQKQRRAKQVLQAPLPPTNLWPAGTTGVFSTAKKITQGGLEEALLKLPGNEKQRDLLSRFMQVHPVKTLFLKQTEMGTGKAARALQNQVREFLGDTWQGPAMAAYTSRRASRLNGFTFRNGSHVVVKVQAADRFDNIAPDRLKRAIARTIVKASGDGERAWSLSAEVREVARDGAGALATWLHEMGHQVHFRAGAPLAPGSVRRALTQYSAVNHMEWHAEHFVAWLVDRDALAAWDPSVAQHFDELLETAITRGAK